jgi:beta-galactosidase
MNRILAVAAIVLVAACSARAPKPRSYSQPVPPFRDVLRLDGEWQVGEGAPDGIPKAFSSVVPVPGLVDMARPAFLEVGKKSPLRGAFWYRRTFTVGGPPTDFAVLKIHKARYGAKVWVNGQVAGDHLPCFTPALLDVKKFLRFGGQENEIVVRVGADRECVPPDQPSGWDFEKYLYIPGIYDSVDLILTGAPYVRNVQVVPDI